MTSNAIETVMGAVVLTVAGGFLYFAYNNSSVKPIDGYQLSATFSNISGISPGSAVRIGGIKVGVVEGLSLDPKTYQAVATLRVGNETSWVNGSTSLLVTYYETSALPLPQVPNSMCGDSMIRPLVTVSPERQCRMPSI